MNLKLNTESGANPAEVGRESGEIDLGELLPPEEVWVAGTWFDPVLTKFYRVFFDENDNKAKATYHIEINEKGSYNLMCVVQNHKEVEVHICSNIWQGLRNMDDIKQMIEKFDKELSFKYIEDVCDQHERINDNYDKRNPIQSKLRRGIGRLIHYRLR